MVLFVCTGNTCRSPFAKAILKKIAKEKRVDFIEAKSAGVNAFNGYPASLHAKETAKAFGVDLSNHASQWLSPEILKKADLILAMSEDHLDRIKEIDSDSLKKTYLLSSFPKKLHRKTDSIKDPIGGKPEDYQVCFQQISSSIQRIFPELVELAQKKILLI
ncbi:MAG: hypothetical protein AMJ90_04280 [candidate division Zixibacteria bacterium SM23_73_2]|nr:MAG: hypothetical protein AMJ90_04280 [candidate division Zixibacteria bacterium SM23_73_2]